MRTWLIAGAAALAAGQAAADPLWDMCHGPGHRGPEQCDCMVGTLRAEFSGADLALYEALAARYLAALDAGKARADAWKQAVQQEASARGEDHATFSARADTLAERHAEIDTRCGGN